MAFPSHAHAGPSGPSCTPPLPPNGTAGAAASNPGPAGAAGPAYTVLRIKRKATDAPLSSLVIQDLEPRLMRKRRRDVSGRPRGVFRLAETVPETWVGRGQEGEVLKSRIQGLLSASSPSSEAPSPTLPTATPGPPETVDDPASSTAVPLPPAGSTSSTTSSALEDPAPRARHDSQTIQTIRTIQTTQFRVVPRSPPISPRTRAMLPPRLMTNAETEAAASRSEADSPLVFVDAQAVSQPSRPAASGSGAGAGAVARASRSNAKSPEEDKEVAMFSSMLEEYLKLEKESQYSAPLATATATATATRVEVPEIQAEEWVYDLYYRDIRTSVPLGIGLGDGTSMTGQLLGYEDISPPSSVSSEAEDEADEDSNEEDYYRNDYPEDDLDDEDEDGYRVAGGDEEAWGESESDGDGAADERGEWDYR